MKGLVFREFANMVEREFGQDAFDDLVDECDLPSGGAYTTVGDYDHQEMLDLVTALVRKRVRRSLRWCGRTANF